VDQTVAVVGDCTSPLLAIAEPPRHRLQERDRLRSTVLSRIPELLATLAVMPGFRVLSKGDLDGPFNAANRPDIPASDVKYRKPATVGGALFNYWD
jgi:hypothetical protein